MSGLHIVALISGGKDSFFSLLHCLQHGHTVVALANLYPKARDGATTDDLDSFMYQTIGHTVIPLYEQAVGLPLYRQEIDGNAVSMSRVYDPSVASASTLKDETEALIPLLRRVKQAHPEVNAVSTGAILSDYQRTRVESVALRLGLTSLTYLWQYPRIVTSTPTSLLDNMSTADQDSRIIKVSSGGLDSSFLWSNVADKRTSQRLLKASQLFGTTDDGAALGEGGEYETLAISGPAPLWKGRIVVEEEYMHVVPGEAGSVSLQITKASCEAGAVMPSQPLPTPALLDQHFENVLSRMQRKPPSLNTVLDDERLIEAEALKNTSSQAHFLGPVTGFGSTAAEQMQVIMQQVERSLVAKSHAMSDIVYTSIILRNMNDFAAINIVYAAAFTRPNPPARATIACAEILQPHELLSVAVTSIKSSSPDLRQGLHVQSISYWAPANIGPYSQAITAPVDECDTSITYIAGQIPLIPATMQLDDVDSESEAANFLHQAVLSLQHLRRIAKVVQIKCWQHVIACLVAPDEPAAAERANIARGVWQEVHTPVEQEEVVSEDDDDDDDDEHFDVWHQQQGSQRTFPRQTSTVQEEADLLSQKPPRLIVIQVDSLPRNASIEWIAFGSNKDDPQQYVAHYHHLLEVFAPRIL